MKYCSTCGTALPAGARFCSECRAPVAETVPVQTAPPVQKQGMRRSTKIILIIGGILLFSIYGRHEVGTSRSTPAGAVPTVDPRLNDGPNAPAPAVNTDMTVYWSKVQPVLKELSTGLDGIVKQAEQLQAQPSLFSDPDWKTAIAVDVVLINSANRDLAAVQPVPASAQEFNRIFLLATQKCSDSANSIATGIGNVDAATMRVAVAQMYQCNTLAGQVRANLPPQP